MNDFALNTFLKSVYSYYESICGSKIGLVQVQLNINSTVAKTCGPSLLNEHSFNVLSRKNKCDVITGSKRQTNKKQNKKAKKNNKKTWAQYRIGLATSHLSQIHQQAWQEITHYYINIALSCECFNNTVHSSVLARQ